MKKVLVLILLPILTSLIIFLTPVYASPGLQLDATDSVNLNSPNFTWWNETSPSPGNLYQLTDWDDKNGDGKLSSSWVGPADWIKLNGQQYEVIYLSSETGGGGPGYITPNDGVVDMEVLYIPTTPRVPEFPLGLAMEIALIPTVAYLVFRKRAKKP